MPLFARRLLSKASVLDSGLPYNWNWQRKWTGCEEFLRQYPIVLMDIGARGAGPPELSSLQPYLQRIGFEPDPEECRRLNTKEDGVYFPCLVADVPGKQTLNLYRPGGYSSTYRLSERFQRLWSGPMPLDGFLELDAVTVDGFLAEHPESTPDILKLDTQGSELSILKGAGDTLARVGLVEVEVEFIEIYSGQPLFSDVAAYMALQGFDLLYLNRVISSRGQVYQGPSRGQLVWADALFGRREDQLEGLSVVRRAKYCILLCQYGHVDIAWQLLRMYPDVADLVPQLGSIFRKHANPAMRFGLMQFDKFLAFALHLRRYNQRGTDTDRAWPIR